MLASPRGARGRREVQVRGVPLDHRPTRRAPRRRLATLEGISRRRKACARTAKSMCARELEAAKSKVSSSGSVLECLKRKHADGDVDDADCVAEIKKKMVSAAGDIREDTALTRWRAKPSSRRTATAWRRARGACGVAWRSTALRPPSRARRSCSSARCGCPATGGSSTRSPTSAHRRRRPCARASPGAGASSGACRKSWTTRRWAAPVAARCSRTRSASTPTCVCIRRSRRRAARTRARCAATSRPAKGACWRASNASARR